MNDREQATVRDDVSPDRQLLQAQWYEALQQLASQDWVACIAQAATTAELAANICVRRLASRRLALPAPIVAALIQAASGLGGIFRRLIRPATKRGRLRANMTHVQKRIESLCALAEMSDPPRGTCRADAMSAIESAYDIMRALAPRESQR